MDYTIQPTKTLNPMYDTTDLSEDKFKSLIEFVVFDYLRNNLSVNVDSEYGSSERWVELYLTNPATKEQRLICQKSFSVQNFPS